MEEIRTRRLTLFPLRAEDLAAYLAGESEFALAAGPASREILTPTLHRAITMKLEKLSRFGPGDWLWITYWLIRVPPRGFGAGMIGYKGPPDPDGEVEIGYGIDPAFRNQGYTTEALQGMASWAFADPRCRRIVAPNTSRANPASNRVLQKVGMRIYAETSESISWCLEKGQEDAS